MPRPNERGLGGTGTRLRRGSCRVSRSAVEVCTLRLPHLFSGDRLSRSPSTPAASGRLAPAPVTVVQIPHLCVAALSGVGQRCLQSVLIPALNLLPNAPVQAVSHALFGQI